MFELLHLFVFFQQFPCQELQSRSFLRFHPLLIHIQSIPFFLSRSVFYILDVVEFENDFHRAYLAVLLDLFPIFQHAPWNSHQV